MISAYIKEIKLSKKTTHYRYNQDNYTALEAITEAQKLAFAPILFQNTLILRDSGILALLDKAGKTGCSLEQITQKIDLSEYAIQLLLDVGLSSHIIYQTEDNYILGKIGYFLLHDTMTKINMDFTNNVCYQGITRLKESFMQNKPAGLSIFSNTETIYPILSKLPQKAKSSWFNFDHFYSSAAFKQVLQYIKNLHPTHLYDLGGNTGKWAIYCANQIPNLKVTILDLPEQTTLAKENIKLDNLTDRIDTYNINFLKAQKLPNQADVWWMSQFLDCFSPQQIIHLLKLINQHMKPNAKICILDNFWDRQAYEASALSLNATSLYFTAMANGNSRFYHSIHFIKYLQQAGFMIEQIIDNLGICSTLIICKKQQ